MTKRTVTNCLFSINSFFSQSKKLKAYISLLEVDFAKQAIELQKLKHILQTGNNKSIDCLNHF